MNKANQTITAYYFALLFISLIIVPIISLSFSLSYSLCNYIYSVLHFFIFINEINFGIQSTIY